MTEHMLRIVTDGRALLKVQTLLGFTGTPDASSIYPGNINRLRNLPKLRDIPNRRQPNIPFPNAPIAPVS